MDLILENILLGVYVYEPEYEEPSESFTSLLKPPSARANSLSSYEKDSQKKKKKKKKGILSLTLNQLLKLPTYYDICGNLLTRLKFELKLRPPLLERMKLIMKDQVS